MQVPERLALIGGGILLSSTLVFTLKAQASNIIPKVEHSISHVYGHVGDTQHEIDFDNGFEQAQRKGWKTGHWGTAPFYIDANFNMYVGKGELPSQDTLRNMLGDGETDVLRSLNITQPVKAPQDSSNLFSTSDYSDYVNHSSLAQINGLENVDTSQTTTMFSMFTNDYQLKSIPGLQNWDVSNVTNMSHMFHNDNELQDLDVSQWNVSNVQDMGDMFSNDTSLTSLDFSGWDDAKIPNASIPSGQGLSKMFGNTSNLQSITLGAHTKVDASNLPGTNWKNGPSTLINYQLYGDHPGTWVKQ